MKKILLLLILSSFTYTMQPHHNHLYAPKPHRAHHLYVQRRSSQLPMEYLIRPDTPRFDESATPPRQTSAPARLEYSIPMSPQEQVHIEEVKARAQESKHLSKNKIACLVATTAITSAVLTAAVTLTIHFTQCQK
jgi:hypothetical protein